MGVDLQTYRAKIGMFRHSFGVDVVTVICCVNFSGSLKSIGSVAFVGLLLLIAGIEQNPGPLEDETDTNVKLGQPIELRKYLNLLGLQNKFPGKITLKEVITICPYEQSHDDSVKDARVKDIPWTMLQRLVSTHSESRDMAVVAHDQDDVEENTLFFDPDYNTENLDISPLDIFHIVCLCCDHNLRQILFQKLYLCKMAVPFMYTDFEPIQTPTLSIWPLRFLTIEYKSFCDDREEKCKETDVLGLPTKVVAFARFGRPQYSKSKLVNSLLSKDEYKTFFNLDSSSGMTPRVICNGFVEMFWLPTIGDMKKDKFQDVITFLNFRGDLQTQFSHSVISMLSNLIDTMAIIIDISSFKQCRAAVEKLAIQFQSVTLIFTNSLEQEDKAPIESFQKSVLAEKSTLNLLILSTHKRKVQQNVTDMVKYVSMNLSRQLQSVCSKSLEERLKVCKLRTDETESFCIRGKQSAHMLFDLMKNEGEPKTWKHTLTPNQCKLTQDLGNLTKKLSREKELVESENIRTQMSIVRKKQMKNISHSLTLFVQNIVRSHEWCFELDFFLGWLKFLIEREKRKVLPPLMHEYRLLWQKLKELKRKESSIKDIECQENRIADMEVKIDEASFSIDHFFRELGHIYDAFLESGEANYTPLPHLTDVAKVVASCIFNCHHFELIDGESFYMPHKWINEVFKVLGEQMGTHRVMTISVMGLQSSGKSTLLNTMFGSQFYARTGRCTRGINMQLIPVKHSASIDFTSPFNYTALIDTEGLRSPELSNIKHEHDNELATVITGLGDMTLLNIMGENTNEIRDILQVIVHAFIRLKRTVNTLDISRCCSFIHQNVTDVSASENMLSGLGKLLQMLDEMTKESARSEGLLDITSFNQVIEFDINSQVWYLKNLWQGNPPMARVNYEYSERVVEIKNTIMQRALCRTDKSYKTIEDILIQGFNLWKGVLNEDFVFSFRNTLEMKAYIEMESFMQNKLWKFEISVHDKMTDITTNNFAMCNCKEDFSLIETKTETEITCYMNQEKVTVLKEIESYFSANKYNDIIIQWKTEQRKRLDSLCTNLGDAIKKQIYMQREKRSIDILTNLQNAMNEEQLRKKSIEIASKSKERALDQTEINRLFDGLWKTCTESVNMSSYSEQSHNTFKKLQNSFIQCLYKIFKTEGSLVTEYLKQSNQLENKPCFNYLHGSFDKSGINSKDISCSVKSSIKNFFGLTKVMEIVKGKIEYLFECFDGKINASSKSQDEINEHHVSVLLRDLHTDLSEIDKNPDEFTFTQTFKVKIFVHVCNFACHMFNEHNIKYQRQQGVKARLEVYREQQRIKFEAQLYNRKLEDTFATLLGNVVEVFIKEKVQESIPIRATDYLFSKVPNVKNQLILFILTELAEQDQFDEFQQYIDLPKAYAERKIRKLCNSFLFDTATGGYYTICKGILNNLYESVRNGIKILRDKFSGTKYETEGDEIIIELIGSFEKQNIIIPKEKFRCLNIPGKIHNVEYLSDAIIAQIEKSQNKLNQEIELTTHETVTWSGVHPIIKVFEKVWGCPEHCTFCGEPCTKNEEHTGSDHYSLQHRPKCCTGSRDKNSEKATMESCNFLVQSDISHNCVTFKYLCNKDQNKDCTLEWHKYKDYKKFLPTWDVPPSSNMHETSKFWLWFVARYKEDLKSRYKYHIDNVPVSWDLVSKQEAIQSIKAIYSA